MEVESDLPSVTEDKVDMLLKDNLRWNLGHGAFDRREPGDSQVKVSS
jgi:hypothetical protein